MLSFSYISLVSSRVDATNETVYRAEKVPLLMTFKNMWQD
jgi:hypothetical protein